MTVFPFKITITGTIAAGDEGQALKLASNSVFIHPRLVGDFVMHVGVNEPEDEIERLVKQRLELALDNLLPNRKKEEDHGEEQSQGLEAGEEEEEEEEEERAGGGQEED